MVQFSGTRYILVQTLGRSDIARYDGFKCQELGIKCTQQQSSPRRTVIEITSAKTWGKYTLNYFLCLILPRHCSWSAALSRAGGTCRRYASTNFCVSNKTGGLTKGDVCPRCASTCALNLEAPEKAEPPSVESPSTPTFPGCCSPPNRPSRKSSMSHYAVPPLRPHSPLMRIISHPHPHSACRQSG